MSGGVCVVGPGAVGGVLACAASPLAGLLGRREGYVDVDLAGSMCSLNYTHYTAGCSATYAILAVKANQTKGALGALAWVRAPVIVVAQNGFGGLEAVEGLLGSSRAVIAGAVVEFGATRSVWRVRLAGPGRLIVGCKRRDCRSDLELLKGYYDGGPVKVVVAADIEPWRWLKAIVNSAVNTLTAVHQVRNGVLLENSVLYRIAHTIVEEGAEAAEAAGVRLPSNPHRYLDQILEATSDNYSSTLQDLLACREPELEFFANRIVEAHPRGAPVLKRALNAALDAFRSKCGLTL